MRKLIASILVPLFIFASVIPAYARARYGSHRIGGYSSHGKGSHYTGGYIRSCHGWACK